MFQGTPTGRSAIIECAWNIRHGFVWDISHGLAWNISHGFAWNISHGFAWNISHGYAWNISHGLSWNISRFSSRIFFENNDREVNNQFLGTNGVVQQDLGNIQFDLTKRTATGGQFALRSVSDYDNNNSVGNRFGNPSSSWQTFLEGEVRQPLFRGGRVDVARIAGPGAATGEYNGILIARTRTDATVSEFKIGVRNLISDIENAYWDLYFAYRDLEAKKLARDNALTSWRRIKALGNERKVGGEADKEGQAREQYFRFEAAVQDAMYGSPGQRTRTNNGTAGGAFRGNGGETAGGGFSRISR